MARKTSGGNYASFWLEAGFNTDNGTGIASNVNNQPSGTSAAPAGTQGLVFNRRSIVMLGGDWGEVVAGRDWNASYDPYTAKYDVFGVGAGAGVNFTAGINPSFIRVSNAFSYTTPKFFGGVSAKVIHYLGENSSAAANKDDGTGDGAKLNYDVGPIGAVIDYARTRFVTGNAIQRGLGFVYDAQGNWRFSGNAGNDQQGALHQIGFDIGAIYRIGPNELKAAYSRVRNPDAPAHPTANKISLGWVYNLSKRTAIYSTYARIENSGGATQAIAGSITPANGGSSGFELGMRHNF